MKRSRFVAAVVALLAIVAIPLAYAGGLWFGLPVQGGGTYCQQNLAGVPGTAAVCTSTSPAGPTSMTGFELFPADTDQSGTQVAYPLPTPAAASAAPQTAYYPAANVASGAYQLVVPPTGSISSTLSINNGINTVIANVTGTQTYLAFQMPATPTDGQIIRFASTATLSTAAWITSVLGTNVATTTRAFALYPAGYGGGAAGVVTGPFGVTYLWQASSSTWLRIQ